MKKLLIANRGEIAIRIIRAAKDYGVTSVAIYSDVDASSLHVELADEAYGLGPGRPVDTYLNIQKIVEIAKRAGADAVHPGYGFLSERAEFAQAVLDAGLAWVGPSPQVIRALGDKVEARHIAQAVGAPLVKGTPGPLANAREAVAFAKEAGLPLAIKAAFGGGGRGMKVAHKLEEVGQLFDSAVREATEAFGRGECYAEQFLEQPRHIEAQVIADTHGNTVVLGTRDCSLQRRNQKLVEEAPAPFISEEQREAIHKAARDICSRAGYVGAGTVEFLLSRNGTISFLEVNTRLQVEHPVTEVTTGIDIVVEQLRIADGLPLSVLETPVTRGHAFEFRINAEDPGRGFLPTPGRIEKFRAPSGPGVRLDTGVESGSSIPGLYDSMMAKLIVFGETREQAVNRARRALAEFQIEGVASVLPFHRAVMEEPKFNGTESFGVYTNWIETEFQGLPPADRVDYSEEQLVRCVIEIDGKIHRLGVPTALFSFSKSSTESARVTKSENANSVSSPIPGTLQQWLVEDGAVVKEGETIALVEAMKMETQVLAKLSGKIKILVGSGSAVTLGEELAIIG
ncbi:ATP-grasp domain-containing protein [Pseudomonas sp. SWRI59]|uniref:acetyl/propionyl/methylcrotonyl-CoA carboxylase subunit alpha n=1 Tax=Pseudomonas TaxID=286 RepID=UPI0016496986|nr:MULTISPECIES: biotin carboxylase N-terminal domain-containing protein [unclassified Pseudomonas]MBC3503291.1 ATP-grasp domain-containing protein [Pseudomonas sp. SWRI59]MBC3508706.1 ATP-grasp domain-containing protein [Pseudomonas sp. SWRI68]UDU83441.1 ATP-grasp domain-containing protein [Pseudomonas sp. HN2-3]UPL09093.1 Biotin carboxylase [Pseudomonas sp. IsoF]